ncbi:hypothetical protein [Catenovulum adriaticum]|uniref:Uncharacterized protein n=1 Tax=Catenovulum adriaticum TaxID=2984846 RepID=A0ABY7AR89_9ALTE|nr:hypothetical protein [Catenovulum sp. TS8]WAJ70766.1 hypothetical protein OLW01_02825 [Catenovulum sp. TS8]
MRTIARGIFSPILNQFEQGTKAFNYKPLNRIILNIVGVLFLLLTISIFYLVPSDQSGKFIPIIIFGLASLVCLVVGILGNNRAVAKIWGS